jgi:hypothetical protein
MIAMDPSTISLFHSLNSQESPDYPYGPLINCLALEEELIILAALRILGLLIA